MATLIERLREDQLQARKNRDTAKATLLTTLIGEASMIGKNAGNRESTDDEVTGVIKKFLKNIRETLNALAGKPGAPLMQYENEVLILEDYLPQQMTEDQLRERVTHYFTARSGPAPTKGELMGYLKLFHAGTYDGKMAAQVVDQVMKSTA